MKAKQEATGTNYYFLLNCIGALTAAAIAAAGVIAACALKASTALATGLAIKLALGSTALLAAAFPIIVPVVAVAFMVTAICLLPYLLSGGSYTIGSPSPATTGFGIYHEYNPGVYNPRAYCPDPASVHRHF